MANKLEEARKIINEVDARMAELFLERMRAAELVFAYKKEYGLPILDQRREDQVIAANAARMEDETIRGYYIDYLKNLMAISRAYQYRMESGRKVACSSAEGAFGHIAAERIFPGSTRVSCRDIRSAYDAVVNGECDAAVLPIETGCGGEAEQTLDLIFTGGLFINGIYCLKIPESDLRENTARFAVLSRIRAVSPSLPGSILMFTVRDAADSPEEAIGIIRAHGYAITALRSRPQETHTLQNYYHIEIDGSVDTENGADMMKKLNLVCDRLKVAGTFAPHTEI